MLGPEIALLDTKVSCCCFPFFEEQDINPCRSSHAIPDSDAGSKVDGRELSSLTFMRSFI